MRVSAQVTNSCLMELRGTWGPWGTVWIQLSLKHNDTALLWQQTTSVHQVYSIYCQIRRVITLVFHELQVYRLCIAHIVNFLPLTVSYLMCNCNTDDSIIVNSMNSPLPSFNQNVTLIASWSSVWAAELQFAISIMFWLNDGSWLDASSTL